MRPNVATMTMIVLNRLKIETCNGNGINPGARSGVASFRGHN